MQFRVFFLRSRYRIGIFFGVAKISNIFLGCLKFLIFLGVNGRCWVRAYICGKNKSTPPPPWAPTVHHLVSKDSGLYNTSHEAH